eukprot:TRINITY_DN9150_c0_g2_i1.p1 TRINITY_DN9150_c0_g2~~TRINITY_DN9150_c0_g2_i1.p1  ORF type:complete len:203 (+),score=15.10 TRINITY_DN9150_c0_g2_i1:122-730(+)
MPVHLNDAHGGGILKLPSLAGHCHPCAKMASASPFLENGFRKIDAAKDRYPYCIVWTPLPMITWILPFIGHTGICTSEGIIRDFAGPYYVSEDNMAFGRPTKYLQLDPAKVTSSDYSWDRAVAAGSQEYMKRMHNLCFDNCHSHVARCLNHMRYNDSSSWNMIKIGVYMTLYSRYVSVSAILKTWLPFVIIASIITIALVFA